MPSKCPVCGNRNPATFGTVRVTIEETGVVDFEGWRCGRCGRSGRTRGEGCRKDEKCS